MIMQTLLSLCSQFSLNTTYREPLLLSFSKLLDSYTINILMVKETFQVIEGAQFFDSFTIIFSKGDGTVCVRNSKVFLLNKASANLSSNYQGYV